MGKYDEYIRRSLRDEANGYFMLVNEIAEMNRLKRIEINAKYKVELGDEA